MLFQAYPKIEEDFKRYRLSEEDSRLLHRINWVVTEKIHGANFSVSTDGTGRWYAKRKELLETEDEFFGYKQRLLDMELQVLSLFEALQTDFPALSQITVYGELFGGGYPHPDIAANPDVSLIQSGIYYSPNVEFAVFDIRLFQPENSFLLDYNLVLEYCQAAEISCCQPLFIGTLTQAMDFNYEFNSTIPALLGLPPLDIPNKAEGVVLKPEKGIELETETGTIRPCIKLKIKEFSEAVYGQSFLDSDVKMRLLSLVNNNRLNNAISKIGKISKTDTKKMAQLRQYLQADLVEELGNIEGSTYKKLSASQREVLIEEANNAFEQLIEKMIGG